MALSNNTKDYSLGKGIVYLDIKDSSGNFTGFRDLGNAPGFSFTVETEELEHFSSRAGLREKDDSVVTEVTRSATLTLDSINDHNLALQIVGSAAEVSQTSASVTDEAISSVNQGRLYQIGVDTTRPTGRRGLSSVTVTDDAATPTTFTVDTDYKMDLTNGTIEIVSGGSITDGTNLEVDYTYATNTRTQVKTSGDVITSGRLWYKSTNPKGTKRHLHAPDITIRPTGDTELIGEEWQSFELEIEFNKKDDDTEVFYFDSDAA